MQELAPVITFAYQRPGRSPQHSDCPRSCASQPGCPILTTSTQSATANRQICLVRSVYVASKLANLKRLCGIDRDCIASDSVGSGVSMASDTDCAKLTATRRHLSRWSTAQQHTACRSKTLRATRSHPIIHHAPRGIPHHDKRAKSGAPHPCQQSILPCCTVCRRSIL